ncbi:ABC transporter ATP-binding protein [Labrys wisconsinensis]|uniref:ABC-type glutathione transport system ATPase component n=1 Tax=Labrys wisconsinensis TaxID=425677 RepID=A0ABU0JC18_9HYPH|nr:ABC transporter ATP-binding protein [Labrys wisconsinensis]MDQ0471830.1 ABC-type glutathione transport system ATPase component [Labrys wisconsinensis]
MSGTGARLLRIDAVDAAYRQAGAWRSVLNRISLDVGRGEPVGLVGESGSGKSTLASLALGERRDDRRITAGRVLFEGTDLFAADRASLQRLRGARLAFVPQNSAASLTPTMRIGALFREVLGRHRAASRHARPDRTIEALLADVGIADPAAAAARYPHQFSGGQQQRIALALAISCEPALLVLDEPTTGLDPIIRRSITDLLRRLCRERGIAMLLVSHDLETVADLCERVAVMRAGEVVEVGATRTVFAEPHHAYTRALVEAVPRLDRPATAGGGRVIARTAV